MHVHITVILTCANFKAKCEHMRPIQKRENEICIPLRNLKPIIIVLLKYFFVLL
jgi:hypothetical protein